MKQGLKERGLGVSHVPLKGSLKGLQNEIQLNKSPIELIEIVESISWGNRICHKMRLRKLLQGCTGHFVIDLYRSAPLKRRGFKCCDIRGRV